MANPHKGEVLLIAGEEQYTLRFSIDAICGLEAAAGKGLPALLGELSNPETMSVKLLRQVLHAALAEHHPKLTLKEAGDLVVLAGGFMKVFECVADSIAAAFPEVREAAKENAARPPKGPRRSH